MLSRISYLLLLLKQASKSKKMVLMRTVLILIVALFLLAFGQAAGGKDNFLSVGGEFGRNWLEGNLAIESNNTTSDNHSNLSRADPLSEDWLGITSALRGSNTTREKASGSGKQQLAYSFNQLITPVHQLDASWNQSKITTALPDPDKNGLINGIPAEMYYAIGPAYFDF